MFCENKIDYIKNLKVKKLLDIKCFVRIKLITFFLFFYILKIISFCYLVTFRLG